MKQTKLAKAIAYAIAGVALTAGSASTASAAVTTMYNLTSSYGADNSANTTDPTASGTWGLAGGTDGWASGGPYIASTGTGVNPNGAQWAGTSGTYATPFGYTGAHLNWGFQVSGGNGGSGEISTYDAFNKYGTYADIDVAKGAWSDNSAVPVGWRHDLDMGLFKSDTSGVVTLNVSGIMQAGTDFGFTIFKGMDTVTNYGHHGAWNGGSNATGLSAQSLPWYGPTPAARGDVAGTALSVSDIVAYSVGGANLSNLNSISFNAVAGQVYSIFIGGYRNGGWGETNDGYRLSITQSAVPVPGAVWLFGSALAGLVGAQRRKKLAA